VRFSDSSEIDSQPLILCRLREVSLSFIPSNARKAFIIVIIGTLSYFIDLDQAEQNAGKKGRDQL